MVALVGPYIYLFLLAGSYCLKRRLLGVPIRFFRVSMGHPYDHVLSELPPNYLEAHGQVLRAMAACQENAPTPSRQQGALKIP